jgi:hypothetical protein
MHYDRLPIVPPAPFWIRVLYWDFVPKVFVAYLLSGLAFEFLGEYVPEYASWSPLHDIRATLYATAAIVAALGVIRAFHDTFSLRFVR